MDFGHDFPILFDFYKHSLLSFFDPEISESVFLEIEQPHQRNIIVGVIYGPAGTDPVKTISKMSELLAKISKEP